MGHRRLYKARTCKKKKKVYIGGDSEQDDRKASLHKQQGEERGTPERIVPLCRRREPLKSKLGNYKPDAN